VAVTVVSYIYVSAWMPEIRAKVEEVTLTDQQVSRVICFARLHLNCQLTASIANRNFLLVFVAVFGDSN